MKDSVLHHRVRRVLQGMKYQEFRRQSVVVTASRGLMVGVHGGGHSLLEPLVGAQHIGDLGEAADVPFLASLAGEEIISDA